MTDIANMTETSIDTTPALKISRSARYYRLHREERLEKNKARYDSKPEVIAKREERERIKAEREAAKAAAAAERERKRIERMEIAKKTSRVAAYQDGGA